MNYHQPVLASEIINFFDPKPGQVYFDVTLGNGGHSLEILKKGATVWGLDADPLNLKIATDRINDLGLSQNFHPLLGNFGRIFTIWKKEINQPLDGILADFGLSLNQQSGQSRGFSFKDTSSLDMRLNPKTQALTAEEIINTWDKNQLYQIFTKYTQEKLAKPLIFEIIKARQKKPIKNGAELSQIISSYYQKKHYSSYHQPATKIFLALRIAVNHEFENINKLLTTIPKIVKSGGKVAIISFHSGEDRLVKQYHSKNKLSLQKFLPTHSEVKKNPLSRSAILRLYNLN